MSVFRSRRRKVLYLSVAAAVCFALYYCIQWPPSYTVQESNSESRSHKQYQLPVDDDHSNFNRNLLTSLNHSSTIAAPATAGQDIFQRGKWQRQQIASFCRKHGLSSVNHTLPVGSYRQEVFRHILYDNSSRTLFCFMPKVGCTNMRSTLLLYKNLVPPFIVRMYKRKDLIEKKLERATTRVSFLNQELTDDQRTFILKSYKRFTIVRHPLERLLSAYRDKIEGPILRVISPYNYFEHLKHDIYIRFNPEEYQKWNSTGPTAVIHDTKIHVSFPVFLQWLVTQDYLQLNEHFMPQYFNCEPCRFDYHFYGHFSDFNRDANEILMQFRSDLSLVRRADYSHQSVKTSELMGRYYGQVPQWLKEKLYLNLSLELDFYHHLFPGEKTMTHKILGI